MLLAILLAAYWNIVFLGETLVASANYPVFDFRFERLKPHQGPGHAFMNWHDLGGAWWVWEPSGKFFSRHFRRGRVPLWSPHSAAGVDAHVSLVNSQYFPPTTLLLLLGDTPLLRDLYVLSLLWGSGFCCFVLLWRHGLHRWSAVLMGASYMLTGMVTQWANSMLGPSLAMLPVMVLAFDWFLSRQNWRRVAVGSLVVAAGVLSAFIPVVLSGLLLLALLCLVEMICVAGRAAPVLERLRAVGAVAGKSLCVAMLGLGLAGFLVIPLQHASTRVPEFANWYKNVGLMKYATVDVPSLVSPRVSFDTNQIFLPPQRTFKVEPARVGMFYVGIVVLLLVPCAGFRQQGGAARLLAFFAVGAVVLLGKLLGLYPFQALGHLPVFKYLHFTPYFCGAFALCCCGLAAFGAENLIRNRSSWARVLPILLVIGALIILIGRFVQSYEFNPEGDKAGWIVELMRLSILALAMLVLVACRKRKEFSGGRIGVWLVVLLCLDLVPLAYHWRHGRADAWRNVPPYVRFLQERAAGFRVHGVHDLTLTPNTAQGLGLEQIGTRNAFNSTRYNELIWQSFQAHRLVYPLISSLLPKDRVVLDLLNVKYILAYNAAAAQKQEFAAGGLKLAYPDGLIEVYENTTVWPRVYVAGEVIAARDRQDALSKVPSLRAPHQVIVEGASVSALPGNGNPEKAGTAVITQYKPDEVVVRVSASRPAICVLLDSYAPGWSATVNGQPRPILYANHTFRGVEIPAGESVVRFHYWTPGLTLGLAVSLLSLVIVFALVASETLRGRTARPTET